MIKCVVWDLDNTLWEGTLDNNDNVQLKDGIERILDKLYEKGIPCVVASKNNFDFAYDKIKELNVDKYFLNMKISWNNKYKAIEEVAKELNISIETILFVDDSEMELFECKTYLPDVNLLNAKDYKQILDMVEDGYTMPLNTFNRVEIYKKIQERKEMQRQLTREEFLERCAIEITIAQAKEEDYDRVIQLSERTNQFNLSCQKYTKEILKSSDLIYICRMKDIFGDYGIVAAMVLNSIDDLTMEVDFFAVSCKVEGRNIGRSMIEKLIQICKDEKKQKLVAKFKDNNKNNKLTALFVLYGFVLNKEKNAYSYDINADDSKNQLSKKVNSEITHKIQQIIEKLLETNVKEDESLKNKLTSYMFLNLIVEIEKNFSIEIGLSEVDIQKFDTIGKISNFVSIKLSE